MREISKFEKMHGLEKVRKIPNRYPNKTLISTAKMEKKYFSNKVSNNYITDALEVEDTK